MSLGECWYMRIRHNKSAHQTNADKPKASSNVEPTHSDVDQSATQSQAIKQRNKSTRKGNKTMRKIVIFLLLAGLVAYGVFQACSSDDVVDQLPFIGSATDTPIVEPTSTDTPIPIPTDTPIPTNTPVPPSPTIAPVVVTATPMPIVVVIATNTPAPVIVVTATPLPPTDTPIPAMTQPTDTPTVAVAPPTSELPPSAATATAIPTNTSTPIPPSPTDTPTVIPTATAELLDPTLTCDDPGIDLLTLAGVKGRILEKINVERIAAGLSELSYVDSGATQCHAEDMRDGCFLSHWGSDGIKPHLRYAFAGYRDRVDEIVKGQNYCPISGGELGFAEADAYVEDVVSDLLENAHDRKRILHPGNVTIDIGIAADAHANVWLALALGSDYVDFDTLPYIENFEVFMSGRMKNGAVISKSDGLRIEVYFDPLPKSLTRGQLARSHCVEVGELEARLLRPLPKGFEYSEGSDSIHLPACPNPHQIAPDSLPPSSMEEDIALQQGKVWVPDESVTRPHHHLLIVSSEWEVDESDYSFSVIAGKPDPNNPDKANFEELIVRHGAGVYTAVIYADVDGRRMRVIEYPMLVAGVDVSQDNDSGTATNGDTEASARPEPTSSPTVADEKVAATVAPSATPQLPTVTNTPIPTPTVTSIPTVKPTSKIEVSVTSSRESGLSQDELEHARSLMLDLINESRRSAGLSGVILGDNPAAQIHAADMRSNCFLSHWGSNGMKPSMRYTLTGGEQRSWENASGANYCPGNSSLYIQDPLEDEIRDAMDGLMNSPGHRRNILFPHHRKVNLGFAYRSPNLYVVQLFETDYIDFQDAPAFNSNELSFTATVRNGATVNRDDFSVQIYYDPLPHELSRGQLHRTSCGMNGRILVALRPPFSGGWYYPEDDYLYTESHNCTDPYEVSVNSKPASSYYDLRSTAPLTTENYRVDWVTAKRWNVSGNRISVSADLGSVLREYGNGVYTVMIWGLVDGDDVPISEYSIFVQ